GAGQLCDVQDRSGLENAVGHSCAPRRPVRLGAVARAGRAGVARLDAAALAAGNRSVLCGPWPLRLVSCIRCADRRNSGAVVSRADRRRAHPYRAAHNASARRRHADAQRELSPGRHRRPSGGSGADGAAPRVLMLRALGASRLSLFANEGLRRATDADSWAASVLARDPQMDPAALQNHPMRNALTNVVGSRPKTTVHVSEHALSDGELLILTTDGVHG